MCDRLCTSEGMMFFLVAVWFDLNSDTAAVVFYLKETIKENLKENI